MIVVDTHVWVWLVSDPERLSPRARKRVNRAIAENGVYISCISAWEVALLAATGRLQFTLQVAEWIARCETLPFLNFVPVDNRIALQSVHLPTPLHPDRSGRSHDRCHSADLGSRADHQGRKTPHVSTRADNLVNRQAGSAEGGNGRNC